MHRARLQNSLSGCNKSPDWSSLRHVILPNVESRKRVKRAGLLARRPGELIPSLSLSLFTIPSQRYLKPALSLLSSKSPGLNSSRWLLSSSSSSSCSPIRLYKSRALREESSFLFYRPLFRTQTRRWYIRISSVRRSFVSAPFRAWFIYFSKPSRAFEFHFSRWNARKM